MPPNEPLIINVAPTGMVPTKDQTHGRPTHHKEAFRPIVEGSTATGRSSRPTRRGSSGSSARSGERAAAVGAARS